ncbi:MAG TPA: hypothetical protein VFR63_12350 [Gaiellaceae bacterium]|nr:hypothetical protein [Gaiellaceae bacterium]
MDLDVTPEPSPREREAIERALAPLLGKPPDPRGAWWHEGLLESISPEAEPA